MELPLTDKLVDRQRDALYSYPPASPTTEPGSKPPWVTDPQYFKSVRISAVALIKMVMHARSGGSLEVMGLMQGYVDGAALVVTDAFRLPVEGTETRVNAQGDAEEYLVEYLVGCRDESRHENVIGWYHSHPGYGCWLSGIDVATQQLQQLQGPMVAVVIDPDRTVSSNKVDIGAFRTYPDNYMGPAAPTTASASASASAAAATTTTTTTTTSTTTTSSSSSASSPDHRNRSIPRSKAQDYGAHASKYYPLAVSHFKSTLDAALLGLLWNKYWVQTLAQNPLLTNREFANSQMDDVGLCAQETAAAVSRSGGGGGARGGMLGVGRGSSRGGGAAGGGKGIVGDGGSGDGGGGSGSGGSGIQVDKSMEKLVRDVEQIAAQERAGLLAAEVKARIFFGGSSGGGE